MSDGIEITTHLTIPWHEIRFAASRASGPGGQHVNTADTKIELRWNARRSAVLSDRQRERILDALATRINQQGELLLTCAARRSQLQNRQEVIRRFAQLLRRALAPRRRRVPTVPSANVRERRLREKKRRAEKKQLRKRPQESD